MKNKELPTPFVDVMVTYKKTTYSGKKEIITKRGFYSDSFGTFSVPPEYQMFNGVLSPHGFGGDHMKPENIISWVYCEDQK